MKYIKTYEKCTDEEKILYDYCDDSWYWRISNKYPDILITFDKLGIPKEEFDWLWSEDNHILKDIYLFKTKYDDGHTNWSHSDLGWKNPSYCKPPKYMGKVEITDKDIERYYLNKNTKKYNL